LLAGREALEVLGSIVLDGETFDGAIFCPEMDRLTIPSMCAIDSRSIFMYSSPFLGDDGGLGGLEGRRPFCYRPFSFLSFLSTGGEDGMKWFRKVSVESEAQEEIEVIWDDEPVSEASLPWLRFRSQEGLKTCRFKRALDLCNQPALHATYNYIVSKNELAEGKCVRSPWIY
jgi:hypothetical protein